MIVPEEALTLPEGARLRFDILNAGSKTSKKIARRTAPSTPRKIRSAPKANARIAAFMQAFGVMRDHPAWRSHREALLTIHMALRN